MSNESLNASPITSQEQTAESPDQVSEKLNVLFQDPDSAVVAALKEKGLDKPIPERESTNNFNNPAFVARHEEYDTASREKRRELFTSARESISKEDETTQAKLADQLFDEIVGDGELPKSGRLDTVYGYQQQFAGTTFAKRFQARENSRLKKYGYSAAFPESGFADETSGTSTESIPETSMEPKTEEVLPAAAVTSRSDVQTAAQIDEVKQRLGIMNNSAETAPVAPLVAETAPAGPDLAQMKESLLANPDLSKQDWNTVPQELRDNEEFVRAALMRGAEFEAVASERLATDPAMLLDGMVIAGTRVTNGQGSEAAYNLMWSHVPQNLRTDARFIQATTAGMNGNRDYNYLRSSAS